MITTFNPVENSVDMVFDTFGITFKENIQKTVTKTKYERKHTKYREI